MDLFYKQKKSKNTHLQNKRTIDFKQRHYQNFRRYIRHKTFIKPHLRLIKKETSQRSNIIKILAHTTWGFKSKLLIQLHKALIRSKLEYCSELYLSVKNGALKTIDPIHNTCLRLAIDASKSSPVESIYIIASEPLSGFEELN